MEPLLGIYDDCSPLEALLSRYIPILECLVDHLPTASKLALAQSSRRLRRVLHHYPLFFSHLDFRLSPVYESAVFDTYPPGTVYNLDRLLQSLPVEGRIVSLTLDWTAVSGYFLFNKILDRCQQTLEHLSVRGCRKVSIKHHIVPHFVYQTTILPLAPRDPSYKPPALKSLYVYKARGVRRKPFFIDRKPADGDEPSHYLTTLCHQLGIWLDLGLCPTPKLRCPRRREILRQRRDQFCVPFDKRHRWCEGNENLSPVEFRARQRLEQSQGQNMTCWNCEAHIPDRCEACVHQMTCSSCSRPLCHECAYVSSRSSSQDGQDTPPTNTQNGGTNDGVESDLSAVQSSLLVPCCTTSLPAHADNLCITCDETIKRASCSLCSRQLCVKHELDSCRRCEGGCKRLFCFAPPGSQGAGCGALESGKAQMKDCLGCGLEVCGDCRNGHEPLLCSPSPVPSEDGSSSTASGEDMGGVTLSARTSCSCRTCLENYYCPKCWPTKDIPCETGPKSIRRQKTVLGDHITLLEVEFENSVRTGWFTEAALKLLYPDVAEHMIAEFEARGSFESYRLDERPWPLAHDYPDPGLAELRDATIQVADDEQILEQVLAVKPGVEEDPLDPHLSTPGSNGPSSRTSSSGEPWSARYKSTMVYCKWLGRSSADNSWVSWSSWLEDSWESQMVEDFIRMCKVEYEREMLQQRQEQMDGGSEGLSSWDDNTGALV